MLFQFDHNNSFCISLLTSDRRGRMVDRFKKLNMDVTLWDASTPSEVVDIFSGNFKQTVKACAQSHINIWRYIIDNNIEYALILEDDACFDKNWKDKLDMNDIHDNNWNIFFLNFEHPLPIMNKWVPVTNQWLTGGYIISLSGAKQLINKFNNKFLPSDGMTSKLDHCYAFYPWLVIQECLESSLGNDVKRVNDIVNTSLNKISYSRDNYI